MGSEYTAIWTHGDWPYQRVNDIGLFGLIAILVHEEDDGQSNEGENSHIIGHTYDEDDPQAQWEVLDVSETDLLTYSKV